MKVLVTGAAGFIGYHLCKSLLDDGIEVLGIDNINNYYDLNLKEARLKNLKAYKNFVFNKVDISNKKLIANSFNSFNPNIVVNLAAQAGVRYSIENPYAYLDSNLTGFLNIIELCRHNNVEGLIYASSSSVYGGNTKTPFSVNDPVEKPLAFYAATKRSNELIAYSYNNLYGLNTTGLRYFTVYGPWGRPDMAMFIFINNIINGKKINLYNNGDIYRDFTYIDDIVKGTKQAINKNYNCEIFNLGNNKKEKLSHIIELIENELNLNAIITNKAIKKGDMLETFADITASEDKLNYSPEINIEVGIPKLIKWFKEYYKC